MFSSSIRATILKAMRTWENVTCLKFVEWEPQHLSYLNFTIKACGCCSFVGRQNERMSQTISIGPGCQTHGIVLHELGHALGFWHEQSRPDRDACGRTLLEVSGTFGSPHAETTRQTADASGRQQGSELPAQQIDETQKSEKAVFEGAGKSQGLSSINKLPSQRQSDLASSDSAATDPVSCQWRIAATREERIRLEFTHMGMVSPASNSQRNNNGPNTASDDRDCIEEYVEVRDGYHSGSPLMVDCGGHLKANQGTISSPGYPREYPPNAKCTWLIEVPTGFSVVLTFDSFEIEGYGDCQYDYVEVFDGPSASSPVLRKICGIDVPPTIQSRHNTMAVRFVTDDVYQDKGFTARFEKTNCGGYLRANEGTFTSPGYPVEYPPNSKCTWRIEIPVGFSVILSFESFEDLAVETIELLLREKYDETENRLGHAQIIQLLKFCLKTYFTFDGTIYEQVKGTPMGSPISGLIAEAVLQRLESLVFRHHRPKFWARYVDDTFVVIERDQVLTFKEQLNAVFPDIQFTMEEEENNQLAFLDVLVCRKDCGGLKTKVFWKATNTTQILNFNSNHPISHKRSCVKATTILNEMPQPGEDLPSLGNSAADFIADLAVSL
nr:unnamed protein product [Spirometra erinaceieuropaei]